MIGVIILLAWVIYGIIAIGAFLADLQAHCPEIANEWHRRDLAVACFFGLFGPLGLLMAVFCTGFFEHGLQFGRKK